MNIIILLHVPVFRPLGVDPGVALFPSLTLSIGAFMHDCVPSADEEGGTSIGPLVGDDKGTARIVLMTGFESFNVDLYKKVSGTTPAIIFVPATVKFAATPLLPWASCGDIPST